MFCPKTADKQALPWQIGQYEKIGDKRSVFVAIECPEEEVAISPLGRETLRSGDIPIVAGHPEDVVRM